MSANDVVVDDIEDIFVRGMPRKTGAESFTPSTSTRSVTPPRRSRPAPEVYAKQTTVLTDVQPRRKVETLDDGVSGATMLPGTQTVFIKTQGCAHNVSDGEYMAGYALSFPFSARSRSRFPDCLRHGVKARKIGRL